MGASIYWRAAIGLWVVWFVTWWAAAWWRNRRAAEAARRTWRAPLLLVVLGMWLLFIQRPGLPPPLWRAGPVLGWSMVGVVGLSFAFAWWARVTMGRLWSGGVERTADHRVIQQGPFAWVRHPIYTALIAAACAQAVIAGTPLALLGAAMFATGFYFKARVEERFLTQELTGYPEYRARVPMLVPLTKFHSARLS